MSDWSVKVLLGTVILASAAIIVFRRYRCSRGPSRKHWRGKVFGHRGCRGIHGIPENTISAFHYAATNGSAGIELDARITKDGHCVCYHDPLLRTSFDIDGDKSIRDLTLAELRRLRYRSDSTATITIPTLEESIIFCRDHRLLLLIDFKELRSPDALVEVLLQLFAKYGDSYLYDNSMVISFSPFELYTLRKRNPRIAVGILYSGRVMQQWNEFALAGVEKPPRRLFFYPSLAFWDFWVTILHTVVSPMLVAPSAMGPQVTYLTKSVCQKLRREQNCVTFVWGQKYMEIEDRLNSSMIKLGIFITVDDNFRDWAAKLEGRREESE